MAQSYPTCRAGLARVNITPSPPCSIAGYYHDRVAVRVRDELFTGVLVLAGGGAPLVLV